MTTSEIFALPNHHHPRLIVSSDDGNKYLIQADQNGSTAIALGNAIVPVDAPIQPPQAFVDAMLSDQSNLELDWSDCGIASIDCSNPAVTSKITKTARAAQQISESPVFDFSGNNLDVASVDGLLAFFAANITAVGTLDLSNQTPPAPPTNDAPSPTVDTPGTGYVDGEPCIFTGGGGTGLAGVVVVESGEVTSITVTNNGRGYTSNPIVTVDSVAGTGATFTFEVFPNANKLTLEGNGWTVTTD